MSISTINQKKLPKLQKSHQNNLKLRMSKWKNQEKLQSLNNNKSDTQSIKPYLQKDQNSNQRASPKKNNR